MALVKGPMTLKWGDNTITDVEEIEVEHEIDSEDYTTIDGRTIEVDGNYKVTATLTLLASDISALAALLPQHFVANGGTMSTGETVTNATGAIDIAPLSCGTSTVYNNLDIISCDSSADVFRILNARTRMEAVEVDEKLRKVMIKFIGETASGEAVSQFFKENTINIVS